MSDPLDFLDGEPPAEPAAAPEIAATPEAPQEVTAESPLSEQGQPRGADGKFAPKESVATPQAPEPVLAPPAPAPAETAQPPNGFVPVDVVKALRDEIRSLKATPPPPAPDRYEDPEGYEAYQQQQTHLLITSNRLDISEELARDKHGDATVDTARDWAMARFQQSPAYRQEVLSSRNPYAKIVADHQRETAFADVQPDEIAQFRAWKAAQAQATAQPAAAPAAPAQSAPTPPRSILAAPSAGGAGPGAIPMGPGQAFDAVIR